MQALPDEVNEPIGSLCCKYSIGYYPIVHPIGYYFVNIRLGRLLVNEPIGYLFCKYSTRSSCCEFLLGIYFVNILLDIILLRVSYWTLFCKDLFCFA